jgi:hypothetical protein
MSISVPVGTCGGVAPWLRPGNHADGRAVTFAGDPQHAVEAIPQDRAVPVLLRQGSTCSDRRVTLIAAGGGQVLAETALTIVDDQALAQAAERQAVQRVRTTAHAKGDVVAASQKKAS